MPHHRKASFRRLFALHEDMFVRAKTSLEKRCLDRLNTLLEEDPTPATDWDRFEVDWDVVKDDYDSVLYVYGHSDGQRIQLSDVANDPKYELLASESQKVQEKGSWVRLYFHAQWLPHRGAVTSFGGRANFRELSERNSSAWVLWLHRYGSPSI